MPAVSCCTPQPHWLVTYQTFNNMSFVLQVSDPYWPDVSSYGYQVLQPHQDAVIQASEQQLDKLRAAMKTSKHSSSRSC